jgi:hypothetical protein
MNIAKNMEAIFLAAAALSLFTSYAQADSNTVQQPRTVAATQVQTVTVVGHRLTAAEKAAL